MVKAHLSGAVDFREMRPRDPGWWRRLNLIIKGLEMEDESRVVEALRSHHLAMISSGALTEEDFSKYQKLAIEGFYRFLGTVRPWESVDPEQLRRDEYSKLRREYVRMFGDPNDPEFQKKLDETLEWMDKRLKEKPQEDAEYELARRFREKRAS